MEVKKRTFTPSKEKIIVDPVMRQRSSLITDPEHEAFFLFGTATISYVLPVDRQNNLLNPFTSDEEREWLEEMLDLDLNHHKTKENFWRTHKVKLGKSPRTLDLSNPKDYLDYVVLRANRKFIAPDGDSAYKLATYRYALIKEAYKTNVKAEKANLEIEAYIALGQLKTNQEDMVNFLKVYGKRVSPESKVEFLVSELMNIIKEDLEGFLSVYHDKENYDMKLLIADAVEAKAIIKNGRKYQLPGGDELCGPGEVPVIGTVIEYLKSPANQDILLAIKARVEKSKD